MGDKTEFTLEELEALFQESDVPEPQPGNEQTTPPDPNPEDNAEAKKQQTKEYTKNVANRINEVRKEERDSIAKQMGFESYDAMIKSKEDKIITDKGYDPKDLEPIVEGIVKSRLENDPRIKELNQFRQKQVEEYATKELAEITKLTGGEITELKQLPKDVIDIWAKTGSLKAAFLQVQGEQYILKARSGVSKGTTEHLKSPAGATPPATKTRPLTADEKEVWKQFHPTMTEEELNKKTMPI